MNIYNIKTQTEYNLSIPNDSLKDSKSNMNFKNYEFYYKEPTLPGSDTPVSFSNDRILNDSLILSSDDNKQTQLNDPVFIHDYAPLLPLYENIWKATPRKIKN